MAFIDAKVLEAAGFTDIIMPRAASVVMTVAGVEGTGKTTWALTAPKPLLYMGTDFGTDGVIQKAKGQIIRPREKDGSPKEYRVNIPHDLRAFVDRQETDKEREKREGALANYIHDNFYLPFRADYTAAIKAGVRSVVWDTALEVWEYVRLSVYGRGATNRNDLRTEANSKMKELIRLANVSNVNLIMVNRLKNKWESYYQGNDIKWRETAEQEMQGFDKAPELVALSLWAKMTPVSGDVPNFEVTVKKCRDRAEFVGQTFPALPWDELMGVLIPEVVKWD
jgi:hypothetical protein